MLMYLQAIESPVDESKFEIVYNEYKDTMYNVAYNILHNDYDAEDAVHYAFIKIAENIHKIGEPKCPKTFNYIVTIVENRAIDIYRAKQVHPVLPYNDDTVGIQVEYGGTNRLAGCILKLPARQRQIMILKYGHGYKMKEIARMLGISYANALKIEQRAKVKLKALCEEAGIEW